MLGPTGSGKSDLSLCIARALGGEIVNCDSLQVYRGFDVGTAKVPAGRTPGRSPSPDRYRGTHRPLHRGRLCAPGRGGDSRNLSARKDAGAGGRHRLLFARTVGGPFAGALARRYSACSATGARTEASGSLHRILARLDPASAARIHPNDKNKTMRALEVRLLEGAPLSSMFERGRAALSRLPARQDRIGSAARTAVRTVERARSTNVRSASLMRGGPPLTVRRRAARSQAL